MDVLLAFPWNETSGKRDVVARINEMDWVNSAAVMVNLWDSSPTADGAAEQACQADPSSTPVAHLSAASVAQHANRTTSQQDAAAAVTQQEALQSRSDAGVTVESVAACSVDSLDNAASAGRGSSNCKNAAPLANVSAASSAAGSCSANYTVTDGGGLSDSSESAGNIEAVSTSPEAGCAAVSTEQLRSAMQAVQGRSPAFVLAQAMLQRAADTVLPTSPIEKPGSSLPVDQS